MGHFRKFITFILLLGSVGAGGAFGAEPTSPAGVAQIEIDEINIIGVSAFSVSDIEKLVEVVVGERLDRGKVVQTAKNLQDFYRSAGYEGVKIETRLTQLATQTKSIAKNILEISVVEGVPTRVAGISVVYDIPGWDRRLNSASGRIGLKSGDIYDREKLLNGYRSLQEALTAWDFLSPRIDEATVDPVAAPTDAPPTSLAKTARWVKIRVKVSLGDRVNFSYRGNSVFPNSLLSSWIEEQRLLGFSQDFTDRIRDRFEAEYRRLGYDHVRIEVFTFEDAVNQRRRITYSITEGPRVEVAQIQFDGNSVFTQVALQEKFLELASPSLSRRYYVAKDVEISAEVLIEWLKSQGYLAAKLVSISRTYRANKAKVDLTIYIYEGEQTITESIRFQGLTVFIPAEVNAILGNSPGQPLNLYTLNEGIDGNKGLKARYRERGYLDVKVKNESTSNLVLYSQENRVAEIFLDLDEGPQYRVSKIEIIGLQKTKVEAVTRELQVREGDVLSEREWYRSEARLRRLGIFATATIKAYPDPDQKDGKILRVVVEEGSPGLVAGGVGLRNDLGGRLFGQISYSNLWGKNHTALLSLTANRRFGKFGGTFCPSDKQYVEDPNNDHCFIEYNAALGYVWPWFSFGETTFRPRISLESTQFKNFDARTVALQLSWERVLMRSWGLTGVFSYSFEIIRQYNANLQEDNQDLRIGSISPTLILDRRDNPLAPSRGTYHTLTFDLARPEFLSQNSPPEDPPIAYSRLQWRNDFYAPLPKGIDLFLSFRTGLEYNLATPPEGVNAGANYAIPLIKQFTLGGVGSLRGFDEQSLFVPSSTAVRGSLTYVNYRAQLDLPFAGAMKFGPFLDAANLNLDRYVLGAFRYGTGVGFHYKSPVGPVNFDIGFNPWPKAGEDTYKLHFSIGNI